MFYAMDMEMPEEEYYSMTYSYDNSTMMDYSYDNSTMMNGTESWNEYDYPMYEDEYYSDDYYYDDYGYEYIDYDLAYMFAPYDWGYSDTWKEGYWCSYGPFDSLISDFGEAPITRDECYDWCESTTKEYGLDGACCNHEVFTDLVTSSIYD